jgi:hypothetical protein
MNITRFIIYLSFIGTFACNKGDSNHNSIPEGCKNAEETGLFFYMGLESEKEDEIITKGGEYNLNLLVENTIQEPEKNPYYLLKDLTEGKQYKLYFSSPVLPIIAGNSYQIYIRFIQGVKISTPPGYFVHNRLKVYSKTGELVFANSTDMGTQQDLLQSEGILVDEAFGTCPTKENGAENIQLLFSCGEGELGLFQGENGLLNCNGKEYNIHVDTAYFLPGAEPDPGPILAYYLILKE